MLPARENAVKLCHVTSVNLSKRALRPDKYRKLLIREEATVQKDDYLDFTMGRLTG